jgi:hypothetical protein
MQFLNKNNKTMLISSIKKYTDFIKQEKKLKIQTFVFAHDEKIILDFKKTGKFLEIENLKYVLLSKRPCDNVKGLDDVIIANEYADNIENFPLLVAFTGWYLIWKNKLIDADTDFINLFEYDVTLAGNFSEGQHYVLKPETQVLSYIPISINDYMFIKDDKMCLPFLKSIQKHYGIDFRKYISKIDPTTVVGMTSNQSMTPQVFTDFMKWSQPVIEDIKNERLVGHMLERMFPLFYLYNKLKCILIQNVIFHYQMDTHNTQDMPDRFNDNYTYLLKTKKNLSKIKVLIFGSGPFKESSIKLTKHIQNLGISNIVTLSEDDLPDDFKNEYSHILLNKKGYGYCIWKPYIISNELVDLKPGEILVYIDSTDFPTLEFFHLVLEHFEKSDIMLVNRGYPHDNWTKRDTFVLMNCDSPEYHNKIQLEAGVLALSKTYFNIKLIKEWLKYCTNENILTEIDQICGLPNIEPFFEHRYDQSILTNLQIKYNIPHFALPESVMKYNYNQPYQY